MDDNDSSNLPILDDIITPGDADKAVQRPPRRIQGTLWDNEPAAEPAATESRSEEPQSEEPHNEEKLFTDIEQPASNAGTLAAEQPPIDTAGPAETHDWTAADNTFPVEQPPPAGPSTDSVDAAQTALTSDDIASLTDEIMACMTPEIERILKEKIRQILANRLPVSTDSEPE
jgi:hypothetical protein